ncbi:DegV family protein [Shouchella lonarensis]|uniref:EDD domain protein, DegV family n=1 Tax=Shouchella lonarensis TaxID=1464122 RepID=A0A1G6L9Y7_9BACI|nr:DegV family protein [Shouchella lonarensis]SDC39968.1 EDD domain protein, DegV family [Shouchella lonarensis]
MGTIKIVTDSTADIPRELIDQYGITVIPLNVHFGEEQYEDGVTLLANDFYAKLTDSDVMPRTSQPSPQQFEDLYRSLKEDGADHIISLHLSSKMSGTVQAATIAKKEVAGEIDVHVCDTKRASYAIGLIVVEVAKRAAAGESNEACLARLDEMLHDATVYFMVDTLEFLQKNGRIGKAAALLGSLLKMKPILSLNEAGEVYPHEKVRGQKKAVVRMLSLLEAQYKQAYVSVGISHAQNEPLANELAEKVRQQFNVESIVITNIGAVIGAHVGPGTVSLSMMHAKT